ncbi:flagellar biosynthesis anti-sigma factor FlgM [SAR92 clade bacterium H921]|nr:flagellar biosynthesis anti-sigma factor FlgM [SAR92 clade bacterium H921]MDG0972340.1 flagellar biosynthesis anti-sigma factor FlgM [Porticoccaceae bacterium]MDG1307804.1 flagellar biosynthesis anti-sigma factor FlgM [Porticoccaceae bacterium]
MTDPISNLGRSAAQLNSSADKVKNQKADASASVAVDKAPIQTSSDEFILSDTAEAALNDAQFDAAKVARIKQAILEGNYPLDAKRIAENFESLERMIGGK